ncbi:MAG TPA: DUF2062 domain-containing protein [Rhodobacteraceae bacterium]|jgi:uncharacterized protein (DUF2062 family)|nr:DUF2062 domain-containing protein [Paracoccaceae bacterium]HBG98519.1 DUF2062 domain-containing protein [Paracoccaceae bacterium]
MFKRREPRHWLTLVGRSFWPRGGWGRATSYVWHRLRRLPDPPHKVARGIGAGVFASFTPLFGFHFVLAGLAAWAVRGSILASLFATLFGNPLTFPLIAGISMTTGNWVLGRDARLPVGDILGAFGQASAELWRNAVAVFTPASAHWDGLSLFWNQVFWPYMLGGLIAGPVAGVIANYVSQPVVRLYQGRRRRKLAVKLQQIAAARTAAAATSPARAEEPNR